MPSIVKRGCLCYADFKRVREELKRLGISAFMLGISGRVFLLPGDIKRQKRTLCIAKGGEKGWEWILEQDRVRLKQLVPVSV